MKLLFISNLFPDRREPYRGLDNAHLLHGLARHCEIRVLSPRPSLPFVSSTQPPLQGRPMDSAFAPVFPKVYYVPRFGSRFNHRLFARGIRPTVHAIRGEFPFDLILCAWAYPDGCAVDLLAAELDVPFVVIAQGSDVHSYLQMPVRRRLITAAFNRSAGGITRSADLSRRLEEAGVAREKLRAIYNGVDFSVFHPGDQRAARNELGLPLEASIILFVGNFYPVKNPSLLVAAHAGVCHRRPNPSCHLVMLGGGPLWEKVRRDADHLGYGQRITLAGRKTSGEVARFMQAADVLCLCSENEGVPNVILEAFACGLRVVATKVGGIPEVLGPDFLGRMVEQGNAQALAAALVETFAQPPRVPDIARHASQFSWEHCAEEYWEMIEEIRQRKRSIPPASTFS